MDVIDSKKLRRGMRAENRAHFSSSRSSLRVLVHRNDSRPPRGVFPYPAESLRRPAVRTA
ncbi:hypothetical protein CN138_30880 [Sinorhizobium meliloti]|nr:hypothetical protein [Sinorhizobium meliloti]QGJ74417.1 hypothetical protein C3L21_10660 [Sinorhizobium meliloti]RMI22417.1 hypothetical protein DA102_008040 [Sinorhizobium meliloti]RVH07693.1 hypothetical protein CN210_08225 [Sinorhizobium meliloti]RVH18608.1 hypothetical protein CN215_29800 [Sinorhizobium meliloti]